MHRDMHQDPREEACGRMSWNYHWRSSPAVSVLEQTIDRLRTENIRLRHDLTNKAGYASKLELVLHQRLETIDALNGKLEAARAQCRRLDEEAECYVAMIQRGPLRDRY